MHDKTFLFVTREYWPGVVNCLENIKSVISEIYPAAKIDSIYIGQNNVGFDIIKRLKQQPPNYLFLGGWDNAMKMIVHNAHKKTKIAVKWCSPVTQIELGGEMPQFAEVWHLTNTNKIHHLGVGLESDFETLRKINGKMCHLPIYLNTSDLDGIEPKTAIRKPGMNCDIFCAANPRKNILAQAFALSNFKEDLTVHVNFGHNVQHIYPAITSNVLEKLVNHGWLGDRKQYLSTIKAMDFAMAVTLSESFNYTAAEHMYYGIPVVCSEVAPFVQGVDSLRPITIRRPEDLSEIEKAVRLLMNDKEARKELGDLSKVIFTEYNTRTKKVLRDNLEEITI